MLNLLDKKKGFTLIELMVVVVIIGILVAIIIPIYGRVQDNAAMRAHEANLRTIDGAISMFTAQYGAQPVVGTTFTGQDNQTYTIADTASDNNVTPIQALVKAGFLDKEPTIPDRVASNPSKFLEQTTGADGSTAISATNNGYWVAGSVNSGGDPKAFPAPNDANYAKAYRAGDTIQ